MIHVRIAGDGLHRPQNQPFLDQDGVVAGYAIQPGAGAFPTPTSWVLVAFSNPPRLLPVRLSELGVMATSSGFYGGGKS